MIINILLLLCQIVLGLAGIYGLYHLYIFLHLWGDAPRPKPLTNHIHRFALIICAKDEEIVIPHLIQSLHNLDYPDEAYSIFVVADNCTDKTADVARAAGATVWERHDPTRKSKGFALNWFFARFLSEHGGDFDACAIFDADNLVDPAFLQRMNDQFNAGNSIVTGYRLSKNPSSTAVSGCSSLFWILQSRSFHLPRVRLNLPCCSVGGTGFAFKLDVLGSQGWQTRSVCEDIEFSLTKISEGYFIAYEPRAIFYDEQPLTLKQSIQQRYRWSLGSFQILSLATPKLFAAMRRGQKRVFDAFVYSLGLLFTAGSGIAWTLMLLLSLIRSKDLLGFGRTLLISAAIGFVLIAAFGLLMLKLERQNWRKSWQAVLYLPFFFVQWTVVNIVVLFYRNTRWHDIPHTETLSLDDLKAPPAD